MDKNKAKSRVPIVVAPQKRQKDKINAKCKVPIQSSVDCENVRINISLCQGSLLSPKWEIQKTGTGNCFNANGSEHPSATFEVTITRPNSPVQLCWFTRYEVVKPDNLVITSRNCEEGVDTPVLIQLKRRNSPDIEPELVQTYEAPLSDFINNVASGQLAVCTDLDPESCELEFEYFLTAQYCYICNGQCYTKRSDCDCPLLTLPPGSCQNNSEYVFSDTLDIDGTLTVTNIDPLPSQECTDLYLVSTTPDFVLNDKNILLTPNCLDENGQVTLTILATLPDTPEECVSGGPSITNTATISLVLGVAPCNNGKPITTVSGQNLCVSNRSCDNPYKSSTVSISCVKPQVCITTDSNCNPKFCLCKVSRPVYPSTPEAPVTIQYDLTVTRNVPICTFTPKFAFTACPGRLYNYKIKKLNGEILQQGSNINPCPIDTSIVPIPDCNFCETTPDCLITGEPIDISILNDDTKVELFIYNENGDLIIPAVTICVPVVETEVSFGDCLRVEGCDFEPSAETIVITEPANNPEIRAQILEFLLSVIQCIGPRPVVRILTPEEVELLLTYGLHFYIILSDECCGDITVTNRSALAININEPNNQIAINNVTDVIHLAPCDTQ